MAVIRVELDVPDGEFCTDFWLYCSTNIPRPGCDYLDLNNWCDRFQGFCQDKRTPEKVMVKKLPQCLAATVEDEQ